MAKELGKEEKVKLLMECVNYEGADKAADTLAKAEVHGGITFAMDPANMEKMVLIVGMIRPEIALPFMHVIQHQLEELVEIYDKEPQIFKQILADKMKNAEFHSYANVVVNHNSEAVN
jgi:NADH/NAD ratio-sensing transcriptional regulator Rex